MDFVFRILSFDFDLKKGKLLKYLILIAFGETFSIRQPQIIGWRFFFPENYHKI